MRFLTRFFVFILVLSQAHQIVADEPAPPAATTTEAQYPNATGNAYQNPTRNYPSTSFSPYVTSPETHVSAAIEHLKAAGLEELAEEMARRADRALLPQLLAKKRSELEALQEKISKLEGEIQALQETVGGGEKQVMVELKLLSVSRQQLRKLGLDVNESSFGRFLFNASGITKPARQQSILAGRVDQSVVFNTMLDALKQKGVVKVVAEPTLVTLAGREGSYFSGGEVPVLEPASGDANLLVMKLRQVGIRIDLLPIVLGDGRIRLDLQSTFGYLDRSASKTAEGKTRQVFNEESLDFGVELRPGQTAAVAGMFSKGKLFAGDADAKGDSADAETEPTELILLVTPKLVENLAEAPGEEDEAGASEVPQRQPEVRVRG